MKASILRELEEVSSRKLFPRTADASSCARKQFSRRNSKWFSQYRGPQSTNSVSDANIRYIWLPLALFKSALLKKNIKKCEYLKKRSVIKIAIPWVICVETHDCAYREDLVCHISFSSYQDLTVTSYSVICRLYLVHIKPIVECLVVLWSRLIKIKLTSLLLIKSFCPRSLLWHHKQHISSPRPLLWQYLVT